MAILCMHIACCVHKATDTHSVYVIVIALPQQQWLHECASMLLLYVRCLSCLYLDVYSPYSNEKGLYYVILFYLFFYFCWVLANK